jgi:hypothetical protein
MQFYGWRRVVLISDQEIENSCVYSTAPIYNLLNGRQGYYVYWIKMSAAPSDSEITDYLLDVQSRSRSK